MIKFMSLCLSKPGDEEEEKRKSEVFLRVGSPDLTVSRLLFPKHPPGVAGHYAPLPSLPLNVARFLEGSRARSETQEQEQNRERELPG